MASYAPLFANTEAWQWTPDLIWVDSLNVTRTPNYFVQQMYSCNRGDEVLPLDISGLEKTNSMFASAVKDEATGEVVIKIINASPKPCKASLKITGGKTGSGQVTVTVLGSRNLADENAVGQPLTIFPKAHQEKITGNTLNWLFHPSSFTVLRISH
jgi:alpha-L-arabinofuranosidase